MSLDLWAILVAVVGALAWFKGRRAGAIEALATAAKSDPSVGAWIVDLDKFYQKQDVVKNGG